MFFPIGDDIERDEAAFQLSTIGLFAICFTVFGLQFSLESPQEYVNIIRTFGLTPAALLLGYELPAHLAVIPPELTLLTSMFLHIDMFHFAGNMLFLWAFGSSVENATGHVRFVILYLLCGLAAGYGQALAEPASTIPVVGASGAISGIMAAYLLVYPFSRVRVAMILGFRLVVIRVPALVVIGGWIALQAWEMIAASASGEDGGVAWTAHIAGFLAGLLLIAVLRRKGVKIFAMTEEV